jgi:hypothetical protein
MAQICEILQGRYSLMFLHKIIIISDPFYLLANSFKIWYIPMNFRYRLNFITNRVYSLVIFFETEPLSPFSFQGGLQSPARIFLTAKKELPEFVSRRGFALLNFPLKFFPGIDGNRFHSAARRVNGAIGYGPVPS